MRIGRTGSILGHLRLGRLKKTLRWRQVVELLEGAPDDASGIARATVLAADRQLRILSGDSSLIYCFWLLTRITWAARSTDFAGELADLGLREGAQAPALTFIAKVSDHVRNELASHPESGPVSELASLSLRRSLTETVGTRGPSLFGNTVEDLQGAFREYSTVSGFSELSQRFFGTSSPELCVPFSTENSLTTSVQPMHWQPSKRVVSAWSRSTFTPGNRQR